MSIIGSLSQWKTVNAELSQLTLGGNPWLVVFANFHSKCPLYNVLFQVTGKTLAKAEWGRIVVGFRKPVEAGARTCCGVRAELHANATTAVSPAVHVGEVFNPLSLYWKMRENSTKITEGSVWHMIMLKIVAIFIIIFDNPNNKFILMLVNIIFIVCTSLKVLDKVHIYVLPIQ